MNDELLNDLLTKLSGGDPEAAARVFTAYAPYLRKVIRQRLPAQLRPKLDSADVLQSAWRDVLAGLKKSNWHFRSPAQLHAFLVRVMRNRCVDRWRQHRRRLEQEQSLTDLPADDVPASRRPGPAEVAQVGDLWERLLGLCPPEHREVLRLKRGGATTAEIAARTGLHEGSVRRALRHLATRLACEA